MTVGYVLQLIKTMIKINDTIKLKVKDLLVNYPHLRDSDNKLIASIWYNESEQSLHNITAHQFLKNFCAGYHSSPESIRRIRQKIQEQEIELRGKSYKERKEKSLIIKNQIKAL